MMKQNNYGLLPFLLFFLSSPYLFAAPSLSLEDYLLEVSQGNPGLRASQLSGEGYAFVSKGYRVPILPYLFANYTKYDDRQETANPSFQGDRTLGYQYSMGLSINSPIGLLAKYSFNVSNTQLRNATLITVPNYYTSYNKLELLQSFMKNGFGSETRAKSNLIESSNLAQSYGNRFQEISQMVAAENTYWRLAFARRTVEVQKEVLGRSNRVLQWAKRRVGLQLGDRADLLQAQTSHDLRRIELMAAQEEEKNAARAFNTLRKRMGTEVAEELKIPSLEKTLSVAQPQKTGTRLDVRAAEYQETASRANFQLDREKLKPELDVFANVAWNGKDQNRNKSIDKSFNSKKSTVSVGVNINIPLDAPSVLKSMRGNAMNMEATSFILEQKRIEEIRDWEEIQSRLTDAKARLNLLRSVESLQKEKYENENQRLLRGRTTTYQALIFEQDYAATQLSTLRTQNEVLQLTAQMKIFRGEQ